MKSLLTRTGPGALALAMLAVSAAAPAQNEMPAIGGGNAEKPVVAKPETLTPHADGGGTTIFGERESPIGLYIMPWRDARAEKDIDRPARLLQEKPTPIDRVVFNRQVEYYDVLAAELKKKGVVTPVAR